MAPARKAAIVESPTVGPPLYFSVIYAASKYPGVESRLVPMISDLQSYPALRDLADSINKQVSDREAKIEQRQQAAMKRASRYTSAQKQGADGSEQAASSVGLTKGRMAIKRIMIINKMTKRS
uniref:Mediator of RNA polymerase II transcription subunit 6 n=1 Tax=Macrostomum lignano TaxID=282301 RepID=A0A1I8G909_9PLAT